MASLFAQARALLTLNFVSSTFTLRLAKNHPQAVDHSSNGFNGALQLAFVTRCLTLPLDELDVGLIQTSHLPRLFVYWRWVSSPGSSLITSAALLATWCGVAGTGSGRLFLPTRPFSDCKVPLQTAARTGDLAEPLRCSWDFQRPKYAMSRMPSPLLVYIIAPDLLAEWPETFRCPVGLPGFHHSCAFDANFPSHVGSPQRSPLWPVCPVRTLGRTAWPAFWSNRLSLHHDLRCLRRRSASTLLHTSRPAS